MMFCRLFILLKLERLMGLGLSVIDKLFRSLVFRQTQLETYKSIIYDSYPWASPSQTWDWRLFAFISPTKRGFYPSLDNFNIEIKSKQMNAPFIPCKIYRVYIFLCWLLKWTKLTRSKSWQTLGLILRWPTEGVDPTQKWFFSSMGRAIIPN